MKYRACELCNAEATIYCDADSAVLCSVCDGKVHGANFLVARHVRRAICTACRGGDSSSPLCPSCCRSDQNGAVPSRSSSSSASSACISSTDSSSAKRKPSDREVTPSPLRLSAEEARAEGILVNWCRKLGTTDDVSSAVTVASQAVALCLSDSRRVPLRVCLAASLWFGMRVSGCSTWRNLRRVQVVTGVPAKVIVAGQVKIERLIKGQRLMVQWEMQTQSHNQANEEGWDECCN